MSAIEIEINLRVDGEIVEGHSLIVGPLFTARQALVRARAIVDDIEGTIALSKPTVPSGGGILGPLNPNVFGGSINAHGVNPEGSTGNLGYV